MPAEANEAAQVYSIHRKDFTDFLGAHPEAAMKAIGILSAIEAQILDFLHLVREHEKVEDEGD